MRTTPALGDLRLFTCLVETKVEEKRMVQVTQAQFDLLGKASFDRRLIAMARAVYPDDFEDIPEADLSRSIDELLPIASGCGLTDEHSAGTFILFSWLYGSDAHVRIPLIRTILGNAQMSAADKTATLANFMIAVSEIVDSSIA